MQQNFPVLCPPLTVMDSSKKKQKKNKNGCSLCEVHRPNQIIPDLNKLFKGCE